jgi:hypothetical protein
MCHILIYDNIMAMSIEYFRQKINSIKNILNNKDILIIIIILLTSFASFGLGRMSIIEDNKKSIYIESSASVVKSHKDNDSIDNITKVKNTDAHLYIASKSGTKYHFPWCSGAKRIKEDNKVWFSTKDEAEKAGYTPARNCKGL